MNAMQVVEGARLIPGAELDDSRTAEPSIAAGKIKVIRGKALIFWDPKVPGKKLDAIDTDQITPADDCVSESLDTLDERWKAGSFRYLMPDFRARVHRGETFVVAGDRFAIGSSREMSPAGLKAIADEVGLEMVIERDPRQDVRARGALAAGRGDPPLGRDHQDRPPRVRRVRSASSGREMARRRGGATAHVHRADPVGAPGRQGRRGATRRDAPCLRRSPARLRWHGAFLHEPAGDKPTPDPSQEGNWPRREGMGVGSRVPMHAHGRKGPLHEPERRAPVRRGAPRTRRWQPAIQRSAAKPQPK